jgi:acyl dehydratase
LPGYGPAWKKPSIRIIFRNASTPRAASSLRSSLAASTAAGFARDWDPMPFHVDDAAGIAAFGSLTAPGLYVLALKQRLIHTLPEPHAVIASLGYDEVRFVAPVRPGDSLTLHVEWISRRPSNSKPDRGVVSVRFALANQDDTTVMSHLDTILVRKRRWQSDAGD